MHVGDKNYTSNIKNGRFIDAVTSFKEKRANKGIQNIRIMHMGVGNIIGEEDACRMIDPIKNPNLLNPNMKAPSH